MKLNKYASKNRKKIRGNNNLHINKILRQAIVKRSRLKNKANKNKVHIDIRNHKKTS